MTPRRTHVGLAIAALSAMLLSGCTDSSSGEASDPPIAANSSAISASAEPKTFTYGASAADIADAIGCTNGAPSPSDSNSESPVTLVEAFICTLKGTEVEVDTFANAADQAAADALILEFAPDMGGVYYASGDGWEVGPTGKDDISSATMKSLAELVVSRAGGKVVHIK